MSRTATAAAAAVATTNAGSVGVQTKGKMTKAAKAALLMDTFGLSADTMTPTERAGAISGYDLRHRIESMVAGITAKPIKHVYKGDGAATAPGLMILPRIVATSLFPMRHVRILLGYTAHEISHQLKTDFGLLMEMLNDTTREKRQKQQIKEFWNAIEDYRIEKLVRKEYPGFHVFIDDTRDFSAKRFCERVDAGLVPPAALANPYRIGSVGLTWIGAELNNYVTRAPRDALNRLDPDLLAWLESWRDELSAVETCVEARDLAIQIIEQLDQLRQQGDDGEGEPDPSQQGSGKQGSGSGGKSDGKSKDKSGEKQKDKSEAGESAPDDGDQEEGQGASKDDAPQDDSTNGADDGKAEEGAGTDDGDAAGSHEGSEDSGDQDDASPPQEGGSSTDGQDEGDEADDAGDPGGSDAAADAGEDGRNSPGGNEGGSNRPRPPVKDGDEKEAAETADLEIDDLAKAISSMAGSEAKDAEVTGEDEIAGMGETDSNAKTENVRRGQAAYAAIRREVGAPAARSAGILRRLLQSRSRRTWQGGRESGDLDFGRVVGMTRGEPDVYRERTDRIAVNTAVSLLLDNSGSMNGHPLRMCQETSVVLDMAIQGTRTNIEITGFTGSAENPVLYRYRAFGQKGQAASASLGNMDTVDLGGTPVSTPLLEAWRRMSQQKEPKRIMIVVSDGGADYNDVSAARAAHDFIVRQGCRVIGIAITGDHAWADDGTAMRAWCDNVQVVKSIDDLPIALTNLVQEALK
jgi:hypothetical protein